MTAHPLLRMLAEQPQLLGEHLAAYAALLAAEGAAAVSATRRRVALQLIAAACGTLAVGLAGVALMLWAALSADVFSSATGWVLFAVPAVPAGVGLWLWRAARPPAGSEAFAALKRQGAADLALLREVCPRRTNFDPPCRLNFDPGLVAGIA